jgi:competence CoiA-like predicted nuclease
MSNHFFMGAINILSNNYEYPKIASKINKYKCPNCNKNVIFKKGRIKQPHFAHYKSDNPCMYYNKPNETQIHKDAKMLMKTLLDNKKNINICRNCNYCLKYNRPYIENIHYDIFDNNTKNINAIIEYKFYYNNSNRSADVALLENNKIKYIFEICFKNKTKEENRHEPWIEINAEDLINNINSNNEIININCIRDYKCKFCVGYEILKQEQLENERIKKEQIKKERIKQEQLEKERREILEKERIDKIKNKIKIEKERRKKYLNQYELDEFVKLV